jgi:hypothetical protein
MKKTLTLLTAICLMFSLAACDKSNEKGEVGSDGNTADNGVTLSSDALASLEPITIITESEDEIKNIINKNVNLKAADDIKMNVPEKAVVLKFESQLFSTEKEIFKEYYEYFLEAFKYNYPDKTLNEDYLFYVGGSSNSEYDEEGNLTKGYSKVKDHYDDLMSGAEGFSYLFYDETYCEDITEWDSQVYFRGDRDYIEFNNGKALSLSGKFKFGFYGLSESDTYPSFNDYSIDYSELVGSYPPDSTESFKLIDKEVPINEAVDFFENYIDNLKYPAKNNVDVTVMQVDVYKINENTYGYKLIITYNYNGVDFYLAPIGRSYMETIHTNPLHQGEYLEAVMVESNNVDKLRGYSNTQIIKNARQIGKLQNIEDIFKKISGNLSEQAKFELREMNFVYIIKLHKGADGNPDIETYGCDVYPVWNFIFHNENDNLDYEIQINAEDGNEFSYSIITPDNLSEFDFTNY